MTQKKKSQQILTARGVAEEEEMERKEGELERGRASLSSAGASFLFYS